ncbi:hypothetical protein [Arachnia propionica]|uniref:SWIM-type domain-containing protein n=1 Tax=Arachnia propionica TaxID=1750 RepID=A0A3P1WNH9_9ACTN|nr:hypothetical protein [Arachnia propionica]RRD47378.1 hypothetical protein EII35_15035 [Arachnia propionica]
MRIAPDLLARIVDALAPRVRKRADALVASPPELGQVVDFGNATVTLAEVEVATAEDQLNCDCLLAPNCAHRAAVALLLPVADADDQDEGFPATPPPTGNPRDRLRTATADDSGPLTTAQRDTLATVRAHLHRTLLVGSRRLSAADRGELAADLHRLRTHGLVTADRGLTGFVRSLSGTDRPNAFGFASALVNLHQLSLLPVDRPAGELLGRARETYHEVGGLKLEPLHAEPIVAASGFAGTQVSFIDGWGNVWQVVRLRPGTLRDVPGHYLAGETWAGISDSSAVLSRHRLLVSNATARADGRLGGGRQVRAARLEPASSWETLPEGYRVVEGPITGGDRQGLEIAGTRLVLLPAARALGAGLATELFGAAVGTEVTCLARGEHLLGMRTRGGDILIPEGLQDVWWPGLDEVDRSWAGTLPTPVSPTVAEVDPSDWLVTSPAVREVTWRWCVRVLDAGRAALNSPRLPEDIAWLHAAGAPFAAELLASLSASTGAGSRRFDGTWEPDPDALAHAWLALSQY